MKKISRWRLSISALLFGSASLCPALALAAEDVPQSPTAIPPVSEIFAQYPKINYGVGEKANQLKRGEYLVKMGDCIACHTSKEGQAFAGGLAFDTPFGTLYSPNITPDKTTGIGDWSEADFNRAVREGILPDGQYAYPAFPFPYYNKLTNQDLADIRAYLKAIPAVNKPAIKNNMMFPFNWRFLQLGWRLMFFEFQKTGPYKLDLTQNTSWNRGAYLVLGLGHCDMCHTPMYYLLSKKFVLGAPIGKYHLAGGFVNGFYAPNITSTRMQEVTENQLAEVFLKNKLLSGGEVQGPMREANQDSFQYLTQNDIHAIYSYLSTVKSKTPPKPETGVGLKGGKKVYEQYCVGCHAAGVGGAPRFGDASAWQPLAKEGLDTLYKNAIHGIGAMPPKGTCATCSDEDIQNAVKYIVNESTAAKAVAPTPKAPKQLTLADGQRIYNQYCASCHNGSYPGAPKTGDKQVWQPLIKKGMDVLIINSVKGINNMPPRGSCSTCSTAEIKAAVKYMVNESKTEGDYMLW